MLTNALGAPVKESIIVLLTVSDVSVFDMLEYQLYAILLILTISLIKPSIHQFFPSLMWYIVLFSLKIKDEAYKRKKL